MWTDGSHQQLANGEGVAGYGAYYGEGDKRNLARYLPGTQQTNNRAELQAVIDVLRIPTNGPLQLCIDSKLTVQGAGHGQKSGNTMGGGPGRGRK